MNEAGSGQTLFTFVRHWSRRWDGTMDGENAARGRDVLAVEAVNALSHGGEPTVNQVAAELDLDQSNASRLLAYATDAGYLTLGRSAADQRRRTASLTASGHQLLAAAHAWQDHVYGVLTSDWSDDERGAFEEAMQRLVAKSPELHDL